MPFTCIKSSDRIVLVVPRLKTLCRITNDCFCLAMLLCGNVELNPGPPTQAMFTSILDCQNFIQREISYLQSQQAGIDNAISNLLAKCSVVDQVLLGLKVKS